jgi:hypothetical protein
VNFIAALISSLLKKVSPYFLRNDLAKHFEFDLSPGTSKIQGFSSRLEAARAVI